MEHLENAQKQVEAFVRASDQFQSAAAAAFAQMDARGTGHVSMDDVAAASLLFFKDVSRAVDDFGIRIKEPSPDEIRSILLESGYNAGDKLGRPEFEELYVAILKYAAVKCAAGFAQKYGLGMAIGFIATVFLKRAVRSVPVVGPIAKPLLALLPAPILGPLLGVLGVFVADRGDLTDVKRKLFPEHGGQFKSG